MTRHCLFLLVVLTAPLIGPRTARAAEGPTAPRYVEASAIDPRAIIPPAPAADSLIERAELEVIVNLQTQRTPAQVLRAQQIQTETIFLFGSDVLGPWFNAEHLPKTAAFFAQLRDEFTPIGHATKKLFDRRRPPFQDARIKPCVEFSDTSSYPSGHATQAALWAGLLAALFPDDADRFAARAAETRWYRVLSGAHHPTDVEAGRMLGEFEARELLKNPAVQQVLRELRAEAAPFALPKAA